MRVEQLELLGALIEIVAQGNAVAPALDRPIFRPELDVNEVARFEHLAKGAEVERQVQLVVLHIEREGAGSDLHAAGEHLDVVAVEGVS